MLIFFTFIAVIAGVANAAIFSYINQMLSNLIEGGIIELRWQLFSFSFLLWLFIFSRRYLSLSIIGFTQEKLRNIKQELILLIIRSGHAEVNKQKEIITNVMSNDVHNIAEAGSVLTSLMSLSILTIGSLIYIASISWKLFFITLFIILAGFVTYTLKMRKVTKAFTRTRELNDKFMRYLNEIISGFKEIWVDHKKGADIAENHVKANLRDFHKAIVSPLSEFVGSQYIGIVLFYVAIAFILLTGEHLLHVKKSDLLSFVFIILYVNGPIEGIILLLPTISDANVSAKRLMDLNCRLNEAAHTIDAAKQTGSASPEKFESLELKNVCFKHSKENANPFEIGPVSLLINRQDIIFIHGQNGSGKTSLILCMLGIYQPGSGTIALNGNEQHKNRSSLFAPVFSDFFLFDKFYGNYSFDPVKANYYIQLFEMDSKVSITSSGFSTTKLSMGQRKRLALIQALLENKPVLVLDEWAADQDPYFRKKFYREIIPVLINEGRTIIAITHDDNYFSVATKLLKMDFGKLEQLNPNHAEKQLA